MDFETLWYEAFPYLYGIGGVVAILLPDGSRLAKISGAVLVVAAVVVIRRRWLYRRDEFMQLPSARDASSRRRKD